MFAQNKVLVLAPHTDDGEFGCGGTIARLMEEGNDIYYAAFSECVASVPKGYQSNILKVELGHAMKVFGIKNDHVFIFDYPVRKFSEYRQNILDDMIKIQKEVLPSMVFAPSKNDIHQDHHIVAVEAMRAFKKTALFSYEVPWNNFVFHNQAYFRLEKRHVEKKIQAIKCYETQKERSYADKTFTYGQARFHGVQIGCQYAEVFEVVRNIY